MALKRLLGLVSLLSLAASTIAAPSIATRATSTVSFEIDLSWGDHSSVGGTPKKSILLNGTIPGPPLRVKQGDKVEFLVNNNLKNETAIHFHGIEQKGTPWSDGVPGLSQKAIQPGKSFLYTFTADASGTYFYHAHFQGQIMDGCYGAIVVQPSADAKRPWSFISNDTDAQEAMTAADNSLQTILVADYTQYTSQELHDIEVSANIDFACADAILLNGVGSVYCLDRSQLTAYTSPPQTQLLAAANPPQLTNKGCLPAFLPQTQGNFTFNTQALPAGAYDECTPSTGKTATITVDPANKWAAISFIGVQGFEIVKYTIDGHKMWVYAVSGNYIVPQQVDQVVLTNGERYSVLIELNQTPADYAIRVANSGLNQVISGFGVLSYKGSKGPASSDPNALSVMNFAGVNTTQIVPFVDKKAVPYPPVEVPQTADQTFIFNVKKLGKPFGAWEWTLQGTEAFNQTRENDDTPMLFQKPADIPDEPIVIRTKMGQVIDLIIKVAGPLAQPHPMHKHSNKAFVLGQGVGNWTFSTVAEAAAAMPAGTFNLQNAPYRDGFVTTGAQGNNTWMALRYTVENPGAFLFHCHMQTHLTGGMAFAMLDGVDKWPKVPEQYLNGNGVVEQLQPKGKTHSE